MSTKKAKVKRKRERLRLWFALKEIARKKGNEKQYMHFDEKIKKAGK